MKSSDRPVSPLFLEVGMSGWYQTRQILERGSAPCISPPFPSLRHLGEWVQNMQNLANTVHISGYLQSVYAQQAVAKRGIVVSARGLVFRGTLRQGAIRSTLRHAGADGAISHLALCAAIGDAILLRLALDAFHATSVHRWFGEAMRSIVCARPFPPHYALPK